MTIDRIAQLLQANVLSGQDLLEEDILSACGADLMSDVLAHDTERMLLLTGLNNAHVVRTAEMLDIAAVVFVRGKVPGQDILDMAAKKNIAILTTKQTLYVACGILYGAGLPGGMGLNNG